ncbi:MAG: LysR family transcriptional regulator [Pseudomonadota bacterium]
MPVAPPRPKLPPLNALRAFEAAARHGGFAGAAEELCVTPGAIAQQIKTLEAWAGAKLFTRKAQGVALSPIGEAVADEFGSAFDQLGEATRSLRRAAAPHEVRIAALPSIAQLWLSPRLAQIHSDAPNAVISLTAMEGPPDLTRELFDICVFFEPAPGAAVTTDLGRDVIFPVCAPTLAPLDEEALDQATLLSDAMWAEDWRLWRGRGAAGPVYSLYALAVEQALQGAGVLIGHSHLIETHLRTGALIAPFERRVELDRSLTLSHKAEGEALRIAEMLSV